MVYIVFQTWHYCSLNRLQDCVNITFVCPGSQKKKRWDSIAVFALFQWSGSKPIIAPTYAYIAISFKIRPIFCCILCLTNFTVFLVSVELSFLCCSTIKKRDIKLWLFRLEKQKIELRFPNQNDFLSGHTAMWENVLWS